MGIRLDWAWDKKKSNSTPKDDNAFDEHTLSCAQRTFKCNVPRNFTDSQIRRELLYIIEDILSVYRFKGKERIGFGNIIKFEDKDLATVTWSLKEILLNACLAKESTINKVYFYNKTLEIGTRVFIAQEPNSQTGLIDLGQKLGKVKPEISLIFPAIYSREDILLMERAFCILWVIYEELDRGHALRQKIVFKMHGLNALFTEPRNQEQSLVMQENASLIKKQYKSIITGMGGVMDSKDSFGTMDSSYKPDDVLAQIKLCYYEIARILKVPLTRLLGRSPEGMNASGEHDEINYERTLERIRVEYLDEFLRDMEIKFEKVSKVDIAKFQSIIQLQNLAGVSPSEKFINRISTLGDEL